jgi:hypothetical protein
VDVLVDADTGALFTRLAAISGRPEITLSDGTGRATVAPGTRLRAVRAEGGLRLTEPEPIPDAHYRYWRTRSFAAAALAGDTLSSRYPRVFSYVSTFYEEDAGQPTEAAARPGEATSGAAEEGSAPAAEAGGAEEGPAEDAGGEEAAEDEPAAEETPAAAAGDQPEAAAEEDNGTELRNGGLGLMGLGAVVAASGFGVNYALDTVVSEEVQPEGMRPGTVMMYSGAGFFVGGVITFLISQF